MKLIMRASGGQMPPSSQIGEIFARELFAGFLETVRRRDAQGAQNFAGVETARRVAVEAMHEHFLARLREAERRQQDTRAIAASCRRRRTSRCPRRTAAGQRLADCADKTGDFLGAFLLHPQQHQEGAELFRQHRAGQDHRHCFFGFVDGEGAGQIAAAAEDGDETGERMRAYAA